MCEYNKETNSYYTVDELDKLKQLGFSWNNKSNNNSEGYDTHYYINHPNYILIGKNNKCIFDIIVCKVSWVNNIHNFSDSFDDFNEALDFINLHNKRSIAQILYTLIPSFLIISLLSSIFFVIKLIKDKNFKSCFFYKRIGLEFLPFTSYNTGFQNLINISHLFYLFGLFFCLGFFLS